MHVCVKHSIHIKLYVYKRLLMKRLYLGLSHLTHVCWFKSCRKIIKRTTGDLQAAEIHRS